MCLILSALPREPDLEIYKQHLLILEPLFLPSGCCVCLLSVPVPVTVASWARWNAGQGAVTESLWGTCGSGQLLREHCIDRHWFGSTPSHNSISVEKRTKLSGTWTLTKLAVQRGKQAESAPKIFPPKTNSSLRDYFFFQMCFSKQTKQSNYYSFKTFFSEYYYYYCVCTLEYRRVTAFIVHVEV